MECRMTVNTPPGQARGASEKFKIIGRFKPVGLEVSEDNSNFTFLLNEPLKKMMKIHQRCSTFQSLCHSVLDQKVTRLVISKDQRLLLDKFLEQTTIIMQVVVPATAEELADLNTSSWDKMKRWFK
jgi:hypothetical protein